MSNKKRDCPTLSINPIAMPVTQDACNVRHENLNLNLKEIIRILRGSGELDNMGLVGAISDIKRDRKWTYALITMLGVPIIFLIINYLMRG